MPDIISLDDARKQLRPSYIDVECIEAACALLAAQVSDITVRSVDAHGAIDPLAYEINAYLLAIQRALHSAMEATR